MPRKPIYAPWTTEVDELLRRLWDRPLTIAAIARRMRRHPGTIQAKAAALGLSPRQSGASFARSVGAKPETKQATE